MTTRRYSDKRVVDERATVGVPHALQRGLGCMRAQEGFQIVVHRLVSAHDVTMGDGKGSLRLTRVGVDLSELNEVREQIRRHPFTSPSFRVTALVVEFCADADHLTSSAGYVTFRRGSVSKFVRELLLTTHVCEPLARD
jgi:hypothetical protein